MTNRISTAAACAALLTLYTIAVTPASAQQTGSATAIDAQPVPTPPVPVAPPPAPVQPATVAPPPAPVQPAPVAPPPAPVPAAASPTAQAPGVTTTTTTTVTDVAPAQPTAPSTAQAALPAQPDTAVSGRDARTLHFTLIPTDMMLEDALRYGQEFAKTPKDFVDLLSSNRSAFDYKRGGMLGEMRRATGVAVWITPTLDARWRGFVEQRTFADAQTHQADFESTRSVVVSPQRTLTFLVEIGNLVSAPANGSAAPVNTSLAADKVAGTHFVLSDDQNNNYKPLPGSGAQRVMVRQQFYETVAPSPDLLEQTASDASYAKDAVSDRSGRLVKIRPAYGDVGSFYIVKFDAFNPDGSARVNRDTKSLTLHVITPEGDKYAYFDLRKIP